MKNPIIQALGIIALFVLVAVMAWLLDSRAYDNDVKRYEQWERMRSYEQ